MGAHSNAYSKLGSMRYSHTILVLASLFLMGHFVAVQDVDHYDPDAQRKVFKTTVAWRVGRVELIIDGVNSNLLGMDKGPSGVSEWELSVRDTPVHEEGRLVSVQRDYEDVFLRTWQSDILGDLDTEASELYGGMERERVSFERTGDGEDWLIVLPKTSPLEADGLLGLQPRVDFSSFAPPEGAEEDYAWDIPIRAMEELLFPVGHPATLLAPKGWAKIAEVDVPVSGAIDSATGKIRATWLGLKQDERISEVDLKIDVTVVLKPESAMAAAGQVYLDDKKYETWDDSLQATDIQSELRANLVGKGTLTWNHELAAFEALDLELAFTSSLELDLAWGEKEIRAQAEVTGDLSLSFER